MNRDLGTHLPVLIVLDKKDLIDYTDLSKWFLNSRFVTYEAADLFDAVEEMCDFTMRDCPDVILLKVGSIGDEYSAIVRFVHQATQHSNDLPIFAFSTSHDYPHSVRNLRQLKTQLEKIVPQNRLRSFSASA